MVGNIRSTNVRRYTIVIVSVPPKPPRPPLGGAPQVPKPPQPGKAAPPKPPTAEDPSVARPLGPKRVTRSMRVPPAAKASPAEMDPDELLKQQLLADVVAHAKRETRAVMLAKVMESYAGRPFIVAFLGLLALGITGYSYLTRAEWVFGAPVAVSQARESHLRFAMFLAAQRVAAYRDSTGGYLPQSLEQVGESWPGVTLHASGDTLFDIRAQGDSGQLMLRSDRDARAFVGLSPNALRRNIPNGGGAP